MGTEIHSTISEMFVWEIGLIEAIKEKFLIGTSLSHSLQ